MAVSNHVRWLKNLLGAPDPLVRLGKFQTGQAIKKGEILILVGGYWVPISSDTAMAGVIAVANEPIDAGDRTGYYEIIVPRPGDVFEFDLAAAGTLAEGTALYYGGTSEKVTVTAGTNVIGTAVGQEHYPAKQGHVTDDASGDAGTTSRTTSYARMTFKKAASYYAVLEV